MTAEIATMIAVKYNSLLLNEKETIFKPHLLFLSRPAEIAFNRKNNDDLRAVAKYCKRAFYCVEYIT